MKQPQYSPYPVEDQTVSIWAGTAGLLDELPVEDILRFEQEFLDYVRRNSKALTTIRETQKLEDDTVNELQKAMDQFKKMFQLHTVEPLIGSGKENVEALADDEIDQEKIVRQKR